MTAIYCNKKFPNKNIMQVHKLQHVTLPLQQSKAMENRNEFNALWHDSVFQKLIVPQSYSAPYHFIFDL